MRTDRSAHHSRSDDDSRHARRRARRRRAEFRRRGPDGSAEGAAARQPRPRTSRHRRAGSRGVGAVLRTRSSSPRCISSPCATRCATSSCSAICRADRQVGYIAIGAAGRRPPAIGHYCVLAKIYDRAGMAGALQAAGFGVAAARADRHVARSGWTRTAAVPAAGGLVTAAVPSPLPVERDGVVRRAASIT